MPVYAIISIYIKKLGNFGYIDTHFTRGGWVGGISGSGSKSGISRGISGSLKIQMLCRKKFEKKNVVQHKNNIKIKNKMLYNMNTT